MNADKDDLDKEIDRDEFKANVLRLAHDVYLRCLSVEKDRLLLRVPVGMVVRHATALVMAASDEEMLRKLTAELAKATGFRDPLAK